ncbi:hypothetical protein HU200_035683 [Digitaria exilis]|uniref:DUF3615 domain-containing protein n=1 Tax=Digitaria exilis TaxID=1010633 RepID=A0A835BIZ3_9POAL|nr:hypothetical protein HU200_035683 [Digitaria exilis]
MGDSVRFKGQVWFHVNFWACCRKNKKIKRFFAEVHYKPPGSRSVCSGVPFPVPGGCMVAEEPLGKYRRSCAFCRGHLGILHPMGRKFVCGNDKDRMVQQLVTGGSLGLEMPFTCRLGAASLNSQ